MTGLIRNALLTTSLVLLGGPALARAHASHRHPAPNYHFDAQEALHPGNISKQQAIAIALKAVGGGKAQSAEFENEDHSLHWKVEIQGTSYNYEVWVSSAGKVLKIVSQKR